MESYDLSNDSQNNRFSMDDDILGSNHPVEDKLDFIGLDQAIINEDEVEEVDGRGIEESVEIVTRGEKQYEKRKIRMYSGLYPFYGIYYTLRYPWVILPAIINPLLKAGITIGLSYTLMKNSRFIRMKLFEILGDKEELRWVLGALLYVLKKGWLKYYFIDVVFKYFNKDLLLEVHSQIVNNQDTIHLLKEVKDDEKKVNHLSYNLVSVKEGELPKLNYVNNPLLKGIFHTIYYFIPSSSIKSMFFNGLISPGLFYFLSPPTAILGYSIFNSKIRGFQLTRSYSRSLNEPITWHKKNQFHLSFLGFTANLLEFIPFIGPFFNFTNTVGTALWLATFHRNKQVLY
ncbi:hypothetical protein K502DRAFT_343293 [Neoconidiobolus thromboides FSU 785]|nr:hypothetical protein K502DRAFT_343293 [Neoconidiobolus thromboides FSU 785]